MWVFGVGLIFISIINFLKTNIMVEKLKGFGKAALGKLKLLVKPIEFAVMIGLPILALVFGGITFKWAMAIIIAYVVLQLTGWGTKHVQQAIDGSKEIVIGVKEEVDKIKK
jgi:hypothetical protein